MKLKIAAFTHQGKLREQNEDTVGVDNWIQNQPMSTPASFTPELSVPVVLLVADGMGGHRSGEIASHCATAFLAAGLSSPGHDPESISILLRESNRKIYDLMLENPEYVGMGTTVAGLYIDGSNAYVFNVGDSRVYRAQDGFLAQISIDDTLDRPTYGETSVKQKTGRITQSLGGLHSFTEIEPHVMKVGIRSGSTFLLCSDGLSDMLTLDEMEPCVGADLETSITLLFEQAMNAGGEDNISLLLARVDDPQPGQILEDHEHGQ